MLYLVIGALILFALMFFLQHWIWFALGAVAIVLFYVFIKINKHGSWSGWMLYRSQIKAEKCEAQMNAQTWVTQLNECGKILKSTHDPEIFFTRFDMLVDCATKLVEAKNAGYIVASFSHDIDAALYEATVNRHLPINEFISKTYRKLLKECEGLKTSKGKITKVEKYFEQIEKHLKKMESANIELLDTLKDESKGFIESWVD